jgi:hypothetical protein
MKIKLAAYMIQLSAKFTILLSKLFVNTYKWLDEAVILGGSFFITFFVDIWKFLVGVGILIFLDMIMAVLAVNKLLKAGDSTQQIRSNKLFRTAAKFVSYSVPIIAAQVMVLLFHIPTKIPIIEGIAAFLCMIEVKSIDEKLKLLTGKSVLKQLIQLFNRKKDDEN